MIIHIKMDIKYNHAITKYFKSYIAVIILVYFYFLKVQPFSTVSKFDYVTRVKWDISRACECAK